MLSVRNFTGANALSSPPPPPYSLAAPSLFSNHVPLKGSYASRVSCCCLKVQEALFTEVPLEARPSMREVFKLEEERNVKKDLGEEEEEEEEEDKKGISKIRVPRQKYIPVSKTELSDAIVSKLFDSKDEINQFRLLCSCLDSILHAEHKSILEEMREDYFLSNSVDNKGTSDEELNCLNGQKEINGADTDSVSTTVNGTELTGSIEEDMKNDMPFHFNYGLDFRNLLESLAKNDKKGSSRVGVTTRFQRAFMQLLDNAQFQELSASDLILTSALNSDYLLTLPIYIDWKKASDSNAIIFRRGYATERQKGLLLVEKLDYLQSRLLQRIFYLTSKPLGKFGNWMKEAFQNASQTQEVQDWVKSMSLWLEDSYFNTERASENLLEIDLLSDSELPIWLAAQRAVSRYEGFLSPVGPRGRLFKKLLRWIGLAPPLPETPYELDNDYNAAEPHLRPNFLSRISLSDIWRPASRKYCGNNLWKMLKTSFSILLSKSVLQEPTFQELILLYTKELSESDSKDKAEVSSLQLKIYERIPIPDLPVVFPDKKLSFRILDTVRLDVATILGLLAYFINYKFEDIVSSPSAIFLDVIAITALVIYVSRVALGYKQTWDRYQLLVNKTLYEKTLASGFGSVHFLLDASELQQYKEAILTYAILLKVKNSKDNCRRGVGDACERFMYEVFKIKAEMPVDKAINTLLRLGLVKQTSIDDRMRLQAIPCREAHEALKARWDSLLG